MIIPRGPLTTVSMHETPIGDPEKVEDLPLARSSSPEVLTRTFLLTVSTRDPVTLECQEAIVKYVKEQCCFAFVVTEHGKNGKLHLHAFLCFDTHRERKKLQENINNRLVKKNGHPDAKNGLATKVTVAYKHDWYDTYLRKEEDAQVLYDNYNRELVTDYFPEQAVQEYLQAHSRASGPVDQHMAEHKRRWTASYPDDSSYESAIQYLKRRMYVEEDMMIIQDKRRLTQLAYALYEYRNKIIEANVEERNYASRMTGNALVFKE